MKTYFILVKHYTDEFCNGHSDFIPISSAKLDDAEIILEESLSSFFDNKENYSDISADVYRVSGLNSYGLLKWLKRSG